MGEAVWGGGHLPQNLSLVLWVKLCKAPTKDVNGSWRTDLRIELQDVADEENEWKFNANQSEDEMSERESDSDISSCAGNELRLSLSLKRLMFS
jgi:hypothetical protein